MARTNIPKIAPSPLADLTRAIYRSETEKALSLIRPNLDFERIAPGVNHTPLMAAIENGNKAVFDALLAAGAGIGPQDEYGETPLHAAAHRGDEAMALALLARGADVNERVDRPKQQVHGRTPLMGAATSGKLAMVKLLLERGADPMAKDANGWTAHTFAEPLNKRIAEHLRKVMNRSPGASDLDLFDAARTGHVERVRALLAQGAKADTRDKLGRTALHWAALGGHVELVRLLLDAGAPADAPDKSGWTPLSLIEDSVDVAKLLLAHGADPNADHGGLSALLYAASCRSPELIAALLDGGGDPNAKDSEGHGLLDHAKSNSPRARKFLKDRLGVARDAIDALHDHLKELPKLAKAPAFAAAAARIGAIFERKPAPWRRRKGVVYFHDVSLQKRLAAHYGEAPATGDAAMEQASRLLTRLQDEVLAEGFTLAFTNAIPEAGRMPLILLPTADKYAALLASGTNGINYGHDAEALVRWLQDMERENPFHLGGCGHDFLHGRFAGAVKNAEALAARMIAFCPDIADQAHASIRQVSRAEQVRAIADGMKKTGWFAFWWD
jgi:ankyrin repeat protein